MTATKTELSEQISAEQLAAEILALHRSHLCELRIVIVEAGVILRGVARCFYGKQMALREVIRLCPPAGDRERDRSDQPVKP